MTCILAAIFALCAVTFSANGFVLQMSAKGGNGGVSRQQLLRDAAAAGSAAAVASFAGVAFADGLPPRADDNERANKARDQFGKTSQKIMGDVNPKKPTEEIGKKLGSSGASELKNKIGQDAGKKAQDLKKVPGMK